MPQAVTKPIALQPNQMTLLQACLDQRPEAPTVLGFGGSRGCAKSFCVRAIALILAMMFPKCIVWIIRRVWDDLNKDHVQPLLRDEHPELKAFWRAQDKELRLPNGSSIFFIHAGDTGRAKRKARGPQARYIFLEQAEEFSEEEIQQLDGSNREAGASPGVCKKILTFNPGGIGTAYLRRVMWLRQFHDNEDPAAFMFIQGYGWDNYEWFRGLGIVSEKDFYEAPAWNEGPEVPIERTRRFKVFTEKTDFGKKLAALPQSQRIGELMGSFEKFAGQYYSEVWEESATVLDSALVGRIVQPWWRRWLTTDWGFSHYATTGWFTSGILSPEQVLSLFGVKMTGMLRIIILYRELVVNDVAEPDLAKLILHLTPESERREIRDHYIGHDAWAKRGSANTVVEQMEPVFVNGGLPRLSRADIDRVGGWRLLFNCWATARRLRKWPGGVDFQQETQDQPAFFVSSGCPETIAAVPMLICSEKDPTDIEKMSGQASDDIADMVRYGLKTHLSAKTEAPFENRVAETYSKYEDPTSRAMAMLRLTKDERSAQYIHRRRRA